MGAGIPRRIIRDIQNHDAFQPLPIRQLIFCYAVDVETVVSRMLSDPDAPNPTQEAIDLVDASGTSHNFIWKRVLDQRIRNKRTSNNRHDDHSDNFLLNTWFLFD